MTANKKMSPQITPSLDEITSTGENIYFEKKEELERDHMGEFVVIEINSKDTFINPDKTKAIQLARDKYPDSLFFITQIGELRDKSHADFLNEYGLQIPKQQNCY